MTDPYLVPGVPGLHGAPGWVISAVEDTPDGPTLKIGLDTRVLDRIVLGDNAPEPLRFADAVPAEVREHVVAAVTTVADQMRRELPGVWRDLTGGEGRS